MKEPDHILWLIREAKDRIFQLQDLEGPHGLLAVDLARARAALESADRIASDAMRQRRLPFTRTGQGED